MQQISTTSNDRDVSIVVPVRNSARELAQCLDALCAKDVGALEIVVVDDGSSDGSADVAIAHGVRVERLPTQVGAAAARNHAARCVGGSVILFVDADVVAGEGALRRALRLLVEHPQYAAAFGSYDDDPGVTTVVSRFRNLLHHHTHQTGEREAETFWTGFGLIKRSALDAAGGFDPGWTGIEDIELGHRLRAQGFRILLEPSMQVKHLKRWTLRSMITTDFGYRARLWSRLILSRGALPDDLNVRRAQRASVVLAGLAAVGIVASPFEVRWLALTVAALAGLWWLNRAFYALLRRRGGWGFALSCVPLHVIYFLSAGGGFALAWIERRLPRFGERKEPQASA